MDGVLRAADGDSTFAIFDVLTESGLPTDADSSSMSATLYSSSGAEVSGGPTVTPATVSGRTGGVRIPIDLSNAVFVAGTPVYCVLSYLVSSASRARTYRIEVT